MEPLTKPGTKKRDTTGALSASYVHVLHSSGISKLYIDAAVDDPRAIIANRVAEKTSKHAAGSSERNRTFLPWVFTTFGGIGPPSVLHLIDTIYSSSSTLSRLSLADHHAVTRRKASFFACLQVALTRQTYRMLTDHTAESKVYLHHNHVCPSHRRR